MLASAALACAALEPAGRRRLEVPHVHAYREIHTYWPERRGAYRVHHAILGQSSARTVKNTLSRALLSVRQLQFFVKLYHVAIPPVSERFFAMEGQLFVGLELF